MDVISPPDAALSSRAEAMLKRRKVRKGTFSCWECKRRKMKCVFDPVEKIACNGCRRRGCQCVSQEHPEAVSTFQGEPRKTSGTQVERRERTPVPIPPEDERDPALDENFASLRGKHTTAHSIIGTQPVPRKYDNLSQVLHQSLPRREVLEKICKANQHSSVLTHELLALPYTILSQNGLRTAETLLQIPEPNAHPVLLSRYMLQLALFLQHQYPDLHKRVQDLSESPQAIMERVADLAIRLVTTNDEFLGSIESLECVMIEAVYKMNVGNLRQGWLANRRAMSMAQLMGLHHADSAAHCKLLDPKTNSHPHNMWFRIVDIDRYLCLMLGAPQGSADRTMASDKALATDTPMGCFERTLCVIASRLLERNECRAGIHNLDLTRTLDAELQKAARRLPSKWWLLPDLNSSTSSQDIFWNIRKLYAQVAHYNLLNQLHLPFMLRSSSLERNYEYSRITCVNASREVLSRFIFLRKFNQVAHSCRLLDFLAIMAAMTLLLAHLDSHHLGSDNLLAHQYFSDRAMIEQVQENMQELNRLNSDALSAQSADLLRRLLTLEVDIESIYKEGVDKISVHVAGAETSPPAHGVETNSVTMQIPYFGTIKITRKGLSKEFNRCKTGIKTCGQRVHSQMLEKPRATGTESVHAESLMHQTAFLETNGIPNMPPLAHGPAGEDNFRLNLPSVISQDVSNHFGDHEVQKGDTQSVTARLAHHNTTHTDQENRGGLPNSILQDREHPGLIAGGDEWAFQGVDMAFFESLMSAVGNDNVDWISTENTDL